MTDCERTLNTQLNKNPVRPFRSKSFQIRKVTKSQVIISCHIWIIRLSDMCVIFKCTFVCHLNNTILQQSKTLLCSVSVKFGFEWWKWHGRKITHTKIQRNEYSRVLRREEKRTKRKGDFCCFYLFINS